MKKLIFVSLILILIAFTACQNSTSLKEKIAKQEEQLYESNSQNQPDKQLMNRLTENYIKYATEKPEDTLAPEYLFKAADISMNTGKSDLAQKQLDKILKNYPDYDKRAEVTFLKGYIYENYQGELSKAKTFYEAFLNKYPEHEFADDVQMSLKHLGKSPEELVKQFEKQSAE